MHELNFVQYIKHCMPNYYNYYYYFFYWFFFCPTNFYFQATFISRQIFNYTMFAFNPPNLLVFSACERKGEINVTSQVSYGFSTVVVLLLICFGLLRRRSFLLSAFVLQGTWVSMIVYDPLSLRPMKPGQQCAGDQEM